jgi:chemotaxis protein methyltransferase CheR
MSLNNDINQLTVQTYQKFTKLIYKETGIDLGSDKKEFLKGRINKRLRPLNINTYEGYYDFLVSHPVGDGEWNYFFSIISTNVTHFFREFDHLQFVKETILPKAASNRKKINIWSAGCSIGAEPYGINMIIDDFINKSGKSISYDIYATDISKKVIAQAISGTYASDVFKETPEFFVKKYFLKGVKTKAGFKKVKPMMKEHIQFSHFNLLHPFNFPIKFDAIFCKNVMIYFDDPTKKKITDKFLNALNPGGYLFIGFSETMSSPRTKNLAPAVYQKVK